MEMFSKKCVLLLILLLLGFYMHISSRYRSYGDKAKLSFTPPNSVIGAISCLKFYYYMYGAIRNRLNVFNGNNIVFARSGQQGNRWLYAEVVVFLQNTVSYLCEIETCLNVV